MEEGNGRNEGVEDVVRPCEEEEEGDCNAAEVDVGVRRRRAHSGDAVIHLMSSSASSSSSSTLCVRGLGAASYRGDRDDDGAVAHVGASHVHMYAYTTPAGDDGVAGDSMSRKRCRRVEVRVTVPAVKAVARSFFARAPPKRFSANAKHSAEHGHLLSPTANHQRRMPRESDAGSDSEQEMSAVLAPAYI